VSENVKIPLELLNQTIYLLEHTDISMYGPPISDDYDAVLSALRMKKRSLDLRQCYADTDSSLNLIHGLSPLCEEQSGLAKEHVSV